MADAALVTSLAPAHKTLPFSSLHIQPKPLISLSLCHAPSLLHFSQLLGGGTLRLSWLMFMGRLTSVLSASLLSTVFLPCHSSASSLAFVRTLLVSYSFPLKNSSFRDFHNRHNNHGTMAYCTSSIGYAFWILST